MALENDRKYTDCLLICDICGDNNQSKSYIKLEELPKSDADEITRKILWITEFQFIPPCLKLRNVCAVCLQRINSLIASIKEIKKKFVITQIVLKKYNDDAFTEEWMEFKKSRTALDLEKCTAVTELLDKEFEVALITSHEKTKFDEGETNVTILRKKVETSVLEEGCTELEWLSDSENYPDIIQENSSQIRTNRRGVSYTSSSHNHIAQKLNGMFVCRLCKNSFKWRHMAEQHVRSQHTQEKPFSCRICKKSFAAAHYLNRHISCVHEKHKFVCEKCGRGFPRKYVLTAHEKIHEGPPTISCPQDDCNKMFYAEHILKAHIVNSHKDRAFICDKCGKPFRTKARLMNHRLRHNEKSIKCPYCPKLFPVKTDLLIHFKYHKGTMPWRCGACNMYFKTTRGLQNHFANSHNERVSRIDLFMLQNPQ